MTNPEHNYAAEERMRGAAKEMYEILQAARFVIGVEISICEATGKLNSLNAWEPLKKAIDAVLAKAEGRS